MESGKSNISNEQLADDFRTLLQGKISDSLIESTVQSLSTQTLATATTTNSCPSYGPVGVFGVWFFIWGVNVP